MILKHSISETRKFGLSDGINHRSRQFFGVLSELLSSVLENIAFHSDLKNNWGFLYQEIL